VQPSSLAGYTNYLQEGVAVAFSHHAQDMQGVARFSTPINGYIDAVTLTGSYIGQSLIIASKVR
jgi:hypothetical protein